MIKATKEDLIACPGFAEQKARRFKDAFDQAFLSSQ
jgi:hypothetical protein